MKREKRKEEKKGEVLEKKEKKKVEKKGEKKRGDVSIPGEIIRPL